MGPTKTKRIQWRAQQPTLYSCASSLYEAATAAEAAEVTAKLTHELQDSCSRTGTLVAVAVAPGVRVL
jgi:hypothetical protein